MSKKEYLELKSRIDVCFSSNFSDGFILYVFVKILKIGSTVELIALVFSMFFIFIEMFKNFKKTRLMKKLDTAYKAGKSLDEFLNEAPEMFP